MSDTLAFVVVRTAMIGIGATLVLDLWSFFLKAAFRLPPPNYALVGRWIGHMPQGRLVHASIAQAPAIPGEHAIGWIVHYLIGIVYAALLIALCGSDWLRAPTLLPALTLGIATVAAPFFVMQPAMGSGLASSKTPNPNVARLRSLAAHTVFGLGLFVSAVTVALVLK